MVNCLVLSSTCKTPQKLRASSFLSIIWRLPNKASCEHRTVWATPYTCHKHARVRAAPQKSCTAETVDAARKGRGGPAHRLGALAAAADGLGVVLHEHAAGVRVVQHGPALALPARHQQRHAEGAALRVA